EQGIAVKRDWAPRNAGTVIFSPNLARGIRAQLRPDLLETRAILDARVRRALAFALDKGALNDSLYEGQNIMAESLFPPVMAFYPEIERAIAKYPYDLRRSEQLMMEAGWARAADGFYASPTEGRLSPELKTNASAQYESEQSIIAAGWRQAGFDIREA